MPDPVSRSERFAILRALLGSIPAVTGEELTKFDWKAESGSDCARDGEAVRDAAASRTVLAQAAQLITAGSDHMVALERALTSPVMTHAPFTLARAVIEASGTCLWLLAPARPTADRIARSMNLRYESIIEQQKWVRSLVPVPPEAVQLEASLPARLLALRQVASRRRIPEKLSKNQEFLGFGSGLPSMTERASAVGLGEVYRQYSGVAHGLTWAAFGSSFAPTEQADRLTQDLRIESAVMIIAGTIDVWLRAVFALFLYAGWEAAPWGLRCDPLLDTAGLNDRIRPWRQAR